MIKQSIKNAMLTAGGLIPFGDNSPTQYTDKQHQYFNSETKVFSEMYAKYSADYVLAKVQGLDPNNPTAWQERYLRMADVVRPSAAILRRADNYKSVFFADRDIQYLRFGTKIETMGSTWLVTNPFNVSGSSGTAIVQRCNAVWNYLDYYGNVVSEPMVVSNTRADANDSDAQEANLITKGYFTVAMQYNDVTAQIDTNTRFILGTGAYRVTGYSDFHQEFTGDYSSVRLLEFTIRYEEPNDEIDDMVNHVAGGKTFSWDMNVFGINMIHAGETTQLTVESTRNGEAVTEPVTYTWTSDNEAIATVDPSGVVTAASNGVAVITATLNQNVAYSANIAVVVEDAEQSYVRFTTIIPDELAAYDDIVIGAAYYENGHETDEDIIWEISGADESKYKVMLGEKTVTIYCFGYSERPLVVTASHGNRNAQKKIRLNGI